MPLKVVLINILDSGEAELTALSDKIVAKEPLEPRLKKVPLWVSERLMIAGLKSGRVRGTIGHPLKVEPFSEKKPRNMLAAK